MTLYYAGLSKSEALPKRLMSVPSEGHKSDVKSDRRGDQLIPKRQALELVPHDVSLPFGA
jgi:hypothetical protein